jgi:hypothetical protein
MRISGRCDGDGFRVRRFPPRFQVVLVLVLLLAGCSKEPDELVLRCEGSVGSFRSPLWTKDGELIATHVKNGAITFSGNGFLLGEKIKLCPEGTLGISSDTFYFDSSGCSGMSKTETRQYGALNIILMPVPAARSGWRFCPAPCVGHWQRHQPG